jgi:hypothetical protein
LFGIIRNGLVGISLLQPGGSVMEMLTAVIGSLIAAPFVARQINIVGYVKSFISKQSKMKKNVIVEG